MCGIFGIVTSNTPIPPGILEQATRSLAHRGPDDSGTVLLKAESDSLEIGFGHRRLAILDLSPLGHQPMQDPVSGNWIVFNGEIYNFCELRHELEGQGVEFKTHCDTEVILAAYRVWGDACVCRLAGMFAFALWDSGRKRLLLARDPMGIKPLYYSHTDTVFMFASEVRTLLKTGLIRRELDPTGVLSYLSFGSVYEPGTMIEGVKSVPAGHVLMLENRSVTFREYWNPLQSLPADQTDQLSAILRDAVMSQLVSDVPVGVFLSGGIDSSALVAVLSHNGVRASTFSLVFAEKEFNEGQYSREVAKRFGAEHHEMRVSQQDTLAVLPSALCAMDQPTIDGINTYIVSAKTRSAGIKVALTGLGADEMFAGYSNFRRVPKMEALVQRLGHLPNRARPLLAWFARGVAGRGDRGRKLSSLAGGRDSSIHPYFLARMLFGVEDRERLLGSEHARRAECWLEPAFDQLVAKSQGLDPVNRVSYLESQCYMRNTLLRDSDCMSMSHGLELRVPFLDCALVEACFRIPGSHKVEGDTPKSLLLASLGVKLPQEIVNRPKRGFTLPLENWLRHEMRPVVEAALLADDWERCGIDSAAVRVVWERFLARETSWSRPWALFVLKQWVEKNLS